MDDGPGPVRASESVVLCDECGEPATFGVWVNHSGEKFRFCKPCTTLWIMEIATWPDEEEE